MLYRMFKYGFKNYFKNGQEAEIIMKKMKFFYLVLKKQVDRNCFTIENITESIFEYKKL